MLFSFYAPALLLAGYALAVFPPKDADATGFSTTCGNDGGTSIPSDLFDVLNKDLNDENSAFGKMVLDQCQGSLKNNWNPDWDGKMETDKYKAEFKIHKKLAASMNFCYASVFKALNDCNIAKGDGKQTSAVVRNDALEVTYTLIITSKEQVSAPAPPGPACAGPNNIPELSTYDDPNVRFILDSICKPGACQGPRDQFGCQRIGYQVNSRGRFSIRAFRQHKAQNDFSHCQQAVDAIYRECWFKYKQGGWFQPNGVGNDVEYYELALKNL